MTGREHFLAIAERKSTRPGFWHGVPHDDTTAKVYSYFGVKDDFELGLKLGSVCRVVSPEKYDMWKVQGRAGGQGTQPYFDFLGDAEQVSLGQEGVFAECEDLEEIHEYPWPDAKNCDFTKTITEIDRTVSAGQAVLSGLWATFFRTAYCYFGMENCFIKMHTHPEMVEAVLDHVVDFYLAANERLFTEASGKIDAMFFGNDLGTQLDLFISPAHFNRFVLPYIERLTRQAHDHGLKVVLHSCGSIYRVIPRIIEAGVDMLHPLQAKAANMDSDYLAKNYRGKIAFLGGVDTQQILPFGTSDEVRKEVRRLKNTFGNDYIVSQSHETLLSCVPVENYAAMADEALKD